MHWEKYKDIRTSEITGFLEYSKNFLEKLLSHAIMHLRNAGVSYDK